MTDSELDAVYTGLCEALGKVGEAQAQLYLARFALLAMVQINDRALLERLIEQAAQGLAPPPPG